MTGPTIGERLRLAGLRASASLSRIRQKGAVPWDFMADLVARAPNRLLIAPQDIRTADATVADDIYSGYFAFGAKIVNVHGESPFLVASPSPEWEAELMGFGWMRHLRAAGTPLAKVNARALIDEWLTYSGRPSTAIAWQPDVAARRLISWLSHSPGILDNAELDFYRRLMRSLARHAAWLRRGAGRGARGRAQLIVAIALVEIALCTEGADAQQRQATRHLANVLNRQILLDGGHIGRNPQTLISSLLDLLPLRQAYVARGVAVPVELNNAIDRMMPMLRLFRHSDGAIALFNGMGQTAQDELSTVLAYDDARSQPLMNAIATGYQRLEGGGIVAVFETGKPPPRDFSVSAHAGTLSFEMSGAGERIIVNCGAPVSRGGPLRQAARFTAAHSTLVLEDTSSCKIAGSDGADILLQGVIISGPRHVPVDRRETPETIEVTSSHDGYAGTLGLIHQRTLRLDVAAGRLEGFDRLKAAGRKAPAEDIPFAIRFHLHPQIKVGSIENGQGALLVTPGGQQWIFHASGFPVSIEESAFFASPEGTRATSQIALSGTAKGGDGIDWVLIKKD